MHRAYSKFSVLYFQKYSFEAAQPVHTIQGAVTHYVVPHSTSEEGNWTLFVAENNGWFKKDC